MANNFFLLTYLTVGSIGAPVPAPTGMPVVSTAAGTYNGPYFHSYDPVFPTFSGEPKPFCADFDADGDKDCIIGTNSEQAYYFENTGRSSSFDFSDTATEDNVLQASSATSYLSPWCGDFDNDNDLDCIYGRGDGKVLFRENFGTETSYSFVADTSTYFFEDSNGDEYDFGDESKPTCADFDGDGDLDCFVGWGSNLLQSGGVTYCRNQGSATDYSQWKCNPSAGIIAEIDTSDISCSYAAPNCADFDNDGDYDCLLGCSSGKIYYYENKGTSTAPDFDRDTEIGDTTDLLNGLETGTYVGPFCTDMTNDGAVDCFVGDGATTEVYYYQSNPYPSAAPSPLPTVSHLPSLVPTSGPSGIPTATPSFQPTISPLPTGVPTSSPSLIPSSNPTVPPTPAPTFCPAGYESRINSGAFKCQPCGNFFHFLTLFFSFIFPHIYSFFLFSFQVRAIIPMRPPRMRAILVQ